MNGRSVALPANDAAVTAEPGDVLDSSDEEVPPSEHPSIIRQRYTNLEDRLLINLRLHGTMTFEEIPESYFFSDRFPASLQC